MNEGKTSGYSFPSRTMEQLLRRLSRRRRRHIQALALTGLVALLAYYTLFLAVITVFNLLPDMRERPVMVPDDSEESDHQQLPPTSFKPTNKIPVKAHKHTLSRPKLFLSRKRPTQREAAIERKPLDLKSALDTHYNIPSDMFVHFYNGSRSRGGLLPFDYFVSNQTPPCKRFPLLENMKFSNGLYQVFEASFAKVYVKSCHLDERVISSRKLRCIVYTVFEDDFFENMSRKFPSPNFFKPPISAILWSPNGDFLAEVMSPTVRAWEGFGWKKELPFLLSFNLTGTSASHFNGRLEAMSLRDSATCSNLTTLVRVTKRAPKQPPEGQRDFVVCLKEVFLPFTDHSVRLTEWLEMMKILGADKVVVFSTGERQHPNVEKVLRHFEDQGLVQIRPSAWPAEYSSNPGIISMAYPTLRKSKFRLVHVLLEMMNLEACLLESISRYKYAVVLDMDELILPKEPETSTWHEMLDYIRSSHPEAQTAPSICFAEQQMFASSPSPLATSLYAAGSSLKETLASIPDYHYFLKQVFMAVPPDSNNGWRKKCIHDLEQVVMVSAHGPEGCREDLHASNEASCEPFEAPIYMGRSFHYRSKCAEAEAETEAGIVIHPCNESNEGLLPLFLDRTIFKYKRVLQRRLGTSLAAIGLFP